MILLFKVKEYTFSGGAGGVGEGNALTIFRANYLKNNKEAELLEMSMPIFSEKKNNNNKMFC